MSQRIFAWHKPPSCAELQHADATHLLVFLDGKTLPDWQQPHLQAALKCVQFTGANVINHVFGKTLWLLPEHALWRDYFGEREIIWQTEIPKQPFVCKQKIYFRQPEKTTPATHVIVVGAGIAGAATAYELARRGVQVSVLEKANTPASAASGNRQGLLYAKISPHPTEQTELLLSGYGYTRRLLEQLLPEQSSWGASGVLHLNHDVNEEKRNVALAQQNWHHHLYYGVSATQASDLAGITLAQGGLFWQHGVWLNPPALVSALLAHENITLHTQCAVLSAKFKNDAWHIHSTSGTFSGSHIVFCTGAESKNVPIIQDFPLQMIRGQTSLVAANSFSGSLKVALSGASYISPAWENEHCFGATFAPNDNQSDWREADDLHNQNALSHLIPDIYPTLDFSGSLKGHAAVRCDSHDHLPVVGALGDPTAMRQVYAKLALDKNYRIHTPCPFIPNAYANTAHGSRGLATAPLCAAQIATQILGEPQLLSRRLQDALNPNRLIIRKIIHHKP